jgi:regulator of RNase E activity RraA
MSSSAAEPLPRSVLEALGRYDTPTICNALELVVPERRLTGYTVRPLVCPFPDLPPIVGYARTATIRSTTPVPRSKQEEREYRMAYYSYVGSGPSPRISVIQDLDGAEAGYGSFWGEVHSAVHKALGCLGVVTDGSVRDIPQFAEGFQALAGMIGPSHAHVHLAGYGEEVRIAGMSVRSGDLVHADRHGAVVIPIDVAAKVPDAAELCNRREAPILAVARGKDFTIEKLRAALASGDEIH